MLMALDIKPDFEQLLGQADRTAALLDRVTAWCMITMRSGLEQTGRDVLRRRGIGAWWPNYQKEVGAKDVQSGKRYKRIILAGVLPGVLLSPVRNEDPFWDHFWSVVDMAPGVINVRRKYDGTVALLGDIDVALIHAIEKGLNKPSPPTTVHSFKPGDHVQFVDDVLSRLTGVVEKINKDGHLVIEVNMFGGMTDITVLPHQIVPA